MGSETEVKAGLSAETPYFGDMALDNVDHGVGWRNSWRNCEIGGGSSGSDGGGCSRVRGQELSVRPRSTSMRYIIVPIGA